MRFIDELMVAIAKALLRGVMAVGTGLVYIPFVALLFLAAMLGTTLFAVFLAAIQVIYKGV